MFVSNVVLSHAETSKMLHVVCHQTVLKLIAIHLILGTKRKNANAQQRIQAPQQFHIALSLDLRRSVALSLDSPHSVALGATRPSEVIPPSTSFRTARTTAASKCFRTSSSRTRRFRLKLYRQTPLEAHSYWIFSHVSISMG